VRATSSGASNNIWHLRDGMKVHFADLTDRTSVDYLIRELRNTSPDRPVSTSARRRTSAGRAASTG
jgi:hypothetical protein